MGGALSVAASTFGSIGHFLANAWGQAVSTGRPKGAPPSQDAVDNLHREHAEHRCAVELLQQQTLQQRSAYHQLQLGFCQPQHAEHELQRQDWRAQEQRAQQAHQLPQQRNPQVLWPLRSEEQRSVQQKVSERQFHSGAEAQEGTRQWFEQQRHMQWQPDRQPYWQRHSQQVPQELPDRQEPRRGVPVTSVRAVRHHQGQEQQHQQLQREHREFVLEQQEQERTLMYERHKFEQQRKEQESESLAREAELRHAKAALEEREAALRNMLAELQEEEEAARRAEKEIHDYPMAEYQKQVDWESTVNVGVAGEVSVGKSTFINVLRGLKPKDAGAAPIGVNQRTMEPTFFSFPQNPSFRLWDLPGYATTEFQQKTKLRDMGIRYYHAIILISDGPLKESMLEVIADMEQHNVPYFVVRNKMDQAILNNKTDFDKAEDETVQEVVSALTAQGIRNPYLISCRDVEKHDFPKLVADVVAAIQQGDA